MNHLIAIRANIIYSKEEKENPSDEDQYKKFTELIFLMDKPTYRRTNDGEVIRERGVEECRFIVGDPAFDNLIKTLTKLKEANPEDLGE